MRAVLKLSVFASLGAHAPGCSTQVDEDELVTSVSQARRGDAGQHSPRDSVDEDTPDEVIDASPDPAAACGPGNFTIPCGGGECPSNSVCDDGKCKCIFGYAYQTCSGAPCWPHACPNPDSWWCESCDALCADPGEHIYCIEIITSPGGGCGDVTFVNTCPFPVNVSFQTCGYAQPGCSIAHKVKPHVHTTLHGVTGHIIRACD